jgi:hypothetical protein
MMNLQTTKLDNLIDLRIWHWEQVLELRAKANRIREFAKGGQILTSRKRLDILEFDNAANFHLKCVQILNDCFPQHTTAERDLYQRNGSDAIQAAIANGEDPYLAGIGAKKVNLI